MKENLNDLVAFLTVVREGSFTRASASLGTSQSAVSQTVSNLENRLQVKLLNRTTRSLTLTEAGEKLCELISPAIEEITIGLDQLANFREKPAGTIRISADQYAIQQVLWPKLAPVLKEYPDINIELITDYGLIDIAKERYDAGVRRGGLISKDMIAIPISDEHKMIVVASPETLAQHKKPSKPEELVHLPCINLKLPTHGEFFPWTFIKEGHQHKIRVKGQVVLNGINQVLQAAFDGLGFAYVPLQLAKPHIKSGNLIPVLEAYSITYPGYHLYYTSRLQSSAAFKIICEALKLKK